MNMQLSLRPFWLTAVSIGLLLAVVGIALLHTDNAVVPVVQGMLKQRWYDPALVMQKSDELKDKEKEFEKRVNEKGDEFKKRAEKIQKESTELEKQRSVLSPEAYKKKRDELETEYTKLTSEAQYAEKKIQQDLQQIRGEYERKLLDLIKEFKDTNKIDVIQPMIPGTFVNKELDVTEQLAEFVNKKYNQETSKKKKSDEKK